MSTWKYQNIKIHAGMMRNILHRLPKPALMAMAKAHGLSVRGSKSAIVDRFPHERTIDLAIRIN
ncbi:MAG TPA: hypothetical protein PLU87_19015 [Sedimentisphaerales bacterium]|nr:hypothetical protein [Sedimentisphaerales bacterium]HRS13206.1 hypothetical protein [Sedimentisphaerales bacterium]